MVAPLTVSEQDLRTLLGIVASEREDLPPRGLPPSLLADLVSLIRCDGVNFFGMDTGQQTFWFDQQVPPDDDDVGADGQVFWENYRGSDFCTYCARSGDLRSVTKLSDFYSARRWHSTALYSDYFRLWGTERALLMVLPAGSASGLGRTVRLEFCRDERGAPDFSERDRALLALLRPHLRQAYFDAERRRSGTPQLTPRQWELLRLLAAGHTNAQIARRLGVSDGTVRIHLQNIYARLQVPSRTAAVTRAFPDLTAG